MIYGVMVRFGFRLWRKKIAVSQRVAAVTLALGIGATTAISALSMPRYLSTVLHDPEQIVVLWSNIQGHRNSTSAGGLSRLATAEQELSGYGPHPPVSSFNLGPLVRNRRRW